MCETQLFPSLRLLSVENFPSPCKILVSAYFLLY